MTTSKCPHGRTIGQTESGTFICFKCRGVEEEQKRIAPKLAALEAVMTASKRLVLALKPCRKGMADAPQKNVEELVVALKALEAVTRP